MEIQGRWHLSGNAAYVDASMSVYDRHFQLLAQTGESQSGAIAEIQVSDRLGNIERKLTLTDGSVFATDDNDGVDVAFREQTKVNGFIHTIESNLAAVLLALVLSVFAGYGFFKWGIPWASHKIAHALPQSTGDVIGANTLEFLDDYIFAKSEIELSQQNEIRQHFKDLLLNTKPSAEGGTISYRLHFRAWDDGDEGIPNALALPSGDIILTDRFVQLSTSQDEIDSVLLHEIGHVEHRHTLEMIAQSTIFTTAIALFTGDASGAADMGIGLGSLLISSSYSRNNESEADQYAFEQMLQLDIDPNSFAAIMAKITEQEDNSEKESDGPKRSENEKQDWIDYLSTHPRTQERIDQAKRYAQCYRKRMIVCDSLELVP